MAPNPPENKRKRGRPPTASRRDTDASRPSQPEDYDADADADADDAERPKKRGRPLRSVSARNGTAEGIAPPGISQASPNRPRRFPRGKEASRLVEAAQAPAQDAKRKRGRAALSGIGAADLESPKVNGSLLTSMQKKAQEASAPIAAPSEGDSLRKRRKRKQVEAQPEPEPEPQPEQLPRRRRGHPPPDDPPEQENTAEQENRKPQQERKKGPPSSQAVPAAPPRSKRPKPSSKNPTSISTANAEQKRPPRRTRDTKRKEPDAEQPAREKVNPRGRRAAQPAPKTTQEKHGEEEDDDAAPPSPEKQYTHVAPRVHRVRQSTIKAKWTPLGEPSLAAISSILHLAHRPILQRLSNTQQRREHTSTALRLITTRITRKIARGLPFPPPAMLGRTPRGSRAAATADNGRAAELDFESVLDAKHALERQLDPALHAVDLLRREKDKLARELDRDYEVLRNLEASARSKGREYRALMKKAHVLAPADEARSRRPDSHDKDGLVFPSPTAAPSKGLFDNLQPEEDDVKALGLQLHGHLESMKNNLHQTEGITSQISRSRAALQDVLFRYLDQEQYEHVLLG